jgi:hypothetical protein
MATRSAKGPFATHKNIVGIEQKLAPLKVGCLEVFDENKCSYFIQVHLERL